ncbi:MAG TPA: hypothetical protein P5340_12210, partial [Defluviicoccus sp.]|nr:hypothetical protein [Defluviicoccus sp.]
ENRVGALTGQQVASQFFLVEGRDPADLLAREERLVDRLRQAQREGHLLGHLALSDFVPSPARQAENRALLAPLITPADGLLRRIGERVGLPAATEDAYAQAFARQTAPLELKEWLSHAAVQTQARLWLGETGRGVASVVALQGLSDLDAVRALTDADDKVHFVDFVGDLSDLFGRLRYEATWLTIASYGLVSALTILRYGWRGGLKVMIPSLFAAFVTLAALGLAGEPLTLFSVMALLLVLGIGVDYGLFLRETKGDAEPTVLAVALAAVSTILAFGLLAFSATAAIRAFGLTVFTGISVGFALSPLCLRATGSPGPAGQALDGRRGVRAPR